jgi:hypothetical protein
VTSQRKKTKRRKRRREELQLRQPLLPSPIQRLQLLQRVENLTQRLLHRHRLLLRSPKMMKMTTKF